MDANDAGEESRSERDEECETYNALTWAILERAGSAQVPDENRAYSIDEENHVACACEKNPQCSQPRASVDEGYAKGEQDPACEDM